MEQRMIDYLQNIANEMRFAQENNDNGMYQVYMEQYKTCLMMAQSVMHKPIAIVHWKVVVGE